MSAAQGDLFLAAEVLPPPRPAPPGLLCPRCTAAGLVRTVWRSQPDGTRAVAATCPRCKSGPGVIGDPGAQPKYEPVPAGVSAAETKAPPASREWIGWVRQSDNVWRPVALAPTLERCWDALLHYPGRGDLLATPCCPEKLSQAEADRV